MCTKNRHIFLSCTSLCVILICTEFLIKLLKCYIKPLALVHHTIYHSVIIFLSSFSTKSNCFAMVTNWKSLIFMIWTEFEAIFDTKSFSGFKHVFDNRQTHLLIMLIVEILARTRKIYPSSLNNDFWLHWWK